MGADGCSALKIELDRSLYVNKATPERTAGVQSVAAVLEDVLCTFLPYLAELFGSRARYTHPSVNSVSIDEDKSGYQTTVQ